MQLKEIKDHINGIESIKRVTLTIEKISMVKTKQILKRKDEFKKYYDELQHGFKNFLYELKNRSHSKLRELLSKNKFSNNENSKSDNILILNFFSNRGLCGFYNYHVFLKFEEFYNNLNKNSKLEVFNIGKKSEKFFKKKNINISYSKLILLNEKLFYDSKLFDDLFTTVIDSYEKSKNLKVFCIYTDHNDLKNVKIEPFLPFRVDLNEANYNKTDPNNSKGLYFQIESDPSIMLDVFMKELIRSKLYIFYLKSMLSENVIRHLSTKKASEKADEKIQEFKIKYNKLRQNKITQEIIEIISSARVILKKQ